MTATLDPITADHATAGTAPAGLARPVLSVRDLRVTFAVATGPVEAVRGVSFDLMPGKTLALVGESGSGKSVTAYSVLRLLPGNARVTGTIELNDVDGNAVEVLGLPPRDPRLFALRGGGAGMVFQEPMTALSPVHRVGEQVAEAVRIHRGLGRKEAWAEAVAMLGRVGIADPGGRAKQYPFEFSGGMRQRVVIAMALVCRPRVLIADEPTTALDVTVQAQVLGLIDRLREETGAGVLFITHDLGVVAQVADDVAVMRAGRVVEVAPVRDLYRRPLHPYTRRLLGSVPGVPTFETGPGDGDAALPDGYAVEDGGEDGAGEPELIDLGGERRLLGLTGGGRTPPLPPGEGQTRSVRVRASASQAPGAGRPGFGALTGARPHPGGVPPVPLPEGEGEEAVPLLRVRGLTKTFPVKAPRRSVGETWAAMRSRGPGALLRGPGEAFTAVDAVDLDLARGETLGLVGESGSGKTTVARCILRAMDPTAGTAEFFDPNAPPGAPPVDLARLPASELRPLRRRVQMIFQDPFASLNPRMTVGDIVAEPLVIHGLGSRRERRDRVLAMLDRVGLPPSSAGRYPHAFSGGQRQRVGIARALVLRPALVVADEATSALDVSVRGRVLALLRELQAEMGLTYLFVAHDLSLVRDFCDRVAVMRRGRLVEHGPAGEVLRDPRHPYTRSLLSAVPEPDPDKPMRPIDYE